MRKSISNEEFLNMLTEIRTKLIPPSFDTHQIIGDAVLFFDTDGEPSCVMPLEDFQKTKEQTIIV
jgi:hypothetical protein